MDAEPAPYRLRGLRLLGMLVGFTDTNVDLPITIDATSADAGRNSRTPSW